MSQDLITQKTSEFDRFPGLILGLDGWILRSVPKELRRQFLAGYEKILRIVFHPDRYTDPAVKASRQNYLQVVAEAIQFMTEDEFNFELASEAVPTHANPFVRLQNAINIRDQVIARTNDELEEDRDKLREAQRAIESLRKLHQTATEDISRKERSIALMRRYLAQPLKDFPVPISYGYHAVIGSYWKPLPGTGYERQFFDELNAFSGERQCDDHSSWHTEDEWKNSIKSLLDEEVEIRFKRLTSRNRERILGSMPVPYLCECLRNLRYHRPKEATVDELLRQLRVDPLSGTGEQKMFWAEFVRPYLLPFYVPGHLLLVRQHPGVNFFLVKAANASKAPDAAIVWGLQQELKDARLKLIEQEKEHRRKRKGLAAEKASMADRNLQLRNKIQVLTKALEIEKGKCTK